MSTIFEQKKNFTFKLLIKSFSSWEASFENKKVFKAVLAAEKNNKKENSDMTLFAYTAKKQIKGITVLCPKGLGNFNFTRNLHFNYPKVDCFSFLIMKFVCNTN